MVAPRVGEKFHLDLDGTVISGRYIEVDPPHRLVITWDRQGTETATPTRALIEITLTPTDAGTTVSVQMSGLSADETDYYERLWQRHLDQVADVLAGREPSAFPGN